MPPVFDNEGTSTDVNVRSGENVTLTCRAEGDPPPRISWRREDDRPILLTDSDPPVKIREQPTRALRTSFGYPVTYSIFMSVY